MNCLYCHKQTKNPKYCSRRCSAIHTNTISPKRKRSNECVDCQDPIITRWKRCLPCRKRTHNALGQQTLEDLETRLSVNNKHPQWKYTQVRQHCQAKNRHRERICQRCLYSLHVEHAHIKPVSMFSKDTKLDTINDPINVLMLCPNCHWEFDKGLFTAEGIC